MPGWPRRLAIAATALAAIGCALVLVGSLLPVWPCTLLEHFRVQYVVGGMVVIGAAAALRLGTFVDVAAIAALLELLVITPDLGSSRRVVPSGAARRVLLLNVHTESTSYAEVRALIDELHPDIIGLVEVSQRWLDELAPSLTSYAGRIEAPRRDNFGLALYAHTPVTGTVEELGGGMPSIVATTAGLQIILTHPLPPISGDALELQYAQLAAIAARARALPEPVVVMGDLNATPWSRAFRRLLAASGLCDTRAGFGVQASFPAASTVLRIPIDHALVSCSIGVADRRIERDVGSDHLPVAIDLVVPDGT